MKVTVESGEKQQVTLTITVDKEEVQKAVNRAAKSLAERVNIPGFRKGKAPKNIVERHVGKDELLRETFDLIGPKAFSDALESESVEPVSRPDIQIETLEEDKDLVFKATVTKRPEVKLGEYKGIKVDTKSHEVTDEDIEKQMKVFQDRQGKMVDVEEGTAVSDGDFTTLDFEGFVDGEPFDGGKGADYPLQIGSGSFIPGFEEQLVGMKVGEEKDVNVTFPEDYHAEDLKGKKAVFKCKINSIKRKEVPEMTDELAQKVSTFKTVAELRGDVKKRLEENAKRQSENEKRAAIIEKATEDTKVDIPEIMIEDRISQMIQEFAMRLEQQGMSFEQYLQSANTDIQKLREQYRDTAEKAVHMELMLNEVAKVENIAVTPEDLTAEVAQMAATYGATPKQVQKIIREQGRVSDLAAQVLQRKTADFIIKSAAE